MTPVATLSGMSGRARRRADRVRRDLRAFMLRAGVASPYSTKRFDRAELRPPACPPGWRVGPPDFVGVGTQRSGTKWWYENVVAHPGVTRVSGPHKELHFFDRLADVDLSPEWVERYHRFFPRPEGAIAGEWTPRYMSNFWTPGLLHEAAPEARLLVLLRDPVERYLSGVALESFRASARGDAPVTLIRTDAFHRSRYAAQLANLLRHFPRERVLVQQYERCLDDPVGELGRTHRFLGLEPIDGVPRPVDARVGPRLPKLSLSPAKRADLVAALVDDVRELVEGFPEIDVELWPNVREAI